MTPELVEWQKIAPNGLVYPWWTHPFLTLLDQLDLSHLTWLEFGGGRSTAWLRSRCKWVDTIEANADWASVAERECAEHGLHNGHIFHYHDNLREGESVDRGIYLQMVPKKRYDVISVDGIFRNECLQLAINIFKGRGGLLIADNWQQDYVWISPEAERLMAPFEAHTFYQPDHKHHEGRPWNTTYWIIPK